MYLKIGKTIRWIWKRCFWFLLLLTTIITLSTLAYFHSIEDFRDLYFNYPEETYQKLENEAEKLAKDLEEIDIAYPGSFETTLRSHFPSANVTLKIYDLGGTNTQVIIERGYATEKQKLFWETFTLVFAAFGISVIFMLAIFVVLDILYFFSWLFNKIYTMRN